MKFRTCPNRQRLRRARRLALACAALTTTALLASSGVAGATPLPRESAYGAEPGHGGGTEHRPPHGESEGDGHGESRGHEDDEGVGAATPPPVAKPPVAKPPVAKPPVELPAVVVTPPAVGSPAVVVTPPAVETAAAAPAIALAITASASASAGPASTPPAAAPAKSVAPAPAVLEHRIDMSNPPLVHRLLRGAPPATALFVLAALAVAFVLAGGRFDHLHRRLTGAPLDRRDEMLEF